MGPSIKILYKMILNGGVIALSNVLSRGVIQMRAECVQGEGVKKDKKTCVRTLCMAPKPECSWARMSRPV